MENSFIRKLIITRSARANSFGFVILLLSLAPVCLSQQIKKKTELVLPQDKLAFEVAKAKSNSGNGNGTGLTILRGIAAAGGNPVPLPEDHSDDPNWDPNTDIAVGLELKPGMRCYSRKGDTATVLGVDGSRVLVEISRVHYFYAGPRRESSLIPAVETGALNFREVGDVPACLNKVNLWIARDVFLALQELSAPRTHPAKQGDSEEGKQAVRSAAAAAQDVPPPPMPAGAESSLAPLSESLKQTLLSSGRVSYKLVQGGQVYGNHWQQVTSALVDVPGCYARVHFDSSYNGQGPSDSASSFFFESIDTVEALSMEQLNDRDPAKGAHLTGAHLTGAHPRDLLDRQPQIGESVRINYSDARGAVREFRERAKAQDLSR